MSSGPLAVIIRPAKNTPEKGLPSLAMPEIVGSMISFIVRSTMAGVMTGAGE
ncbi:hypothetical protein D3C78_1508340 [compost metagenome]